MKIGILGTADIAFRRFLPALAKCGGLTYVGVASRTPEKGRVFQEKFGGEVYDSYEALLADANLDAVYIPLPPALHYVWGKKALETGKHLLMEKPFATSLEEAKELLTMAEERDLAVHENYMFLYHSQLAKAKEIIQSGELGEIRLLRISFGFPKRPANDFRYNKGLGGGALLDCGGYPVRLAIDMLGKTARVTQARLVRPEGYDVDLYGCAVIEDDKGRCAQISFGMDNAYQCQLEVWGSKTTLIVPRVFTAGPDFNPSIILRTSDNERRIELDADDHFMRSICEWMRAAEDSGARKRQVEMIAKQIALQCQLAEVAQQSG